MPPKRKVKHQPASGDGGTTCESSTAVLVRRSTHNNAGRRGAIMQLEKIGDALKSPKKTQRSRSGPMIDVPDDQPVNEFAPQNKRRTTRKGKSKVQDPPIADKDSVEPTMELPLHHAAPGDCFGLQVRGSLPPTLWKHKASRRIIKHGHTHLLSNYSHNSEPEIDYDVLQRHHTKNHRPRPPSEVFLDNVRQNKNSAPSGLPSRRKQKQDCNAKEDDNQPAQCKKMLSIAKGIKDAQGRSSNFGHKALQVTCIATFYSNGSKSFCDHEEFKMAVPYKALLCVTALVKNYLDVYAEHGFIPVGHTIDLAKTKSEFNLLQPKLELVLGHQYHGDKLDKALESWAQEGLIGYMQRIPSNV
ncbi:hypothetical protein BS17DRAFT_882407 [Gyrodon lividus]|nr:hypothetical protein BS17DRAFT_882407 [Gyrodon lividus]